VLISPATADDAPALGALHRSAATVAYAHIFPADSEPPTAAELAAQWADAIDDDRGVVLVARSADGAAPVDGPVGEPVGGPVGSLVGAVAVRPDDSVPSGWLLARLYVDPDHWSAGCGSALHDAALGWLGRRRPAVEAVNLWVLAANHKARAFYQRRGWVLVPGFELANDPPEIVDVLYRRAVDVSAAK
jgi:GNAT superfamily N-acetyltransferase